ncbi:hypothetical protein JCM16161A_15890 [Vulcanisaeta sp. JCM 16161]
MGKLTYVVLFLVITLAVTASVAHAQQSMPQYFTCTEVVPGVPGSNLSHVIVWLRLNNVTTPNGLLYLLDQMYYNLSSPYYHEFITPQEFAEWYSPPGYVFSYITSLAEQNGLIVNYTFPMLIEATGNASAVDNFLTALQSAPSNITQWILAGECIPLGYFAVHSKAPQYQPMIVKEPLPSGLSPGQLLGSAVRVNGRPAYARLNMAQLIAQYLMAKPSLMGMAYALNALRSAQEEWGYAVIWFPIGLEWMYDELPLFYSGYTGQGLTIAIVDAFGDVNFTLASQYVYQNVACNDLATFDSIFYLPPPASCTIIYPTGVPMLTPYNLPYAEGWSWETALDIEYAHTMAPGAKILLVVAPDSGDDLFVDVEYVVNNSLANFISMSWGSWEDMFYYPPPSYNLLYGYDEIFMQAAAEGIGAFAASGDWGAYDVQWFAFNMPMEPSVLYPASDPWVTGVGGTELFAQFIGGYAQRMETAWNWNPFIVWGSGGGYSFTFTETPGQKLISIPYQVQYVYEPDLGIWFNTVGMRGVPDIAADADPYTGVFIVLNGVIPPYFIGGTSLATPLTAGMTTTIQSYLYGTGTDYTIGDLAPSMYLVYHYMPSEAYVSNITITTMSFFSGISGAMFPTLGGDNGLYWSVPYQWSPVTGLGQLNVYGAAQALSALASLSK